MESLEMESSFYFARIQSSKNSQEQLEHFEEFREWLRWLRKRNLITHKEESRFIEKGKSIMAHPPKKARTYIIKFLLVISFTFLCLLIIIIFTINRFTNTSSLQTPLKSQHVPAILPFSGILVDSQGIPIDYPVDVLFDLYADQTSNESLYSGMCMGEDAISPDSQGAFTIALGRDCGMLPIPDTLFTDFPVIYLGVTINDGEELSSRYLINTYTYLNPQSNNRNSDSDSLFELDVQNNEIKLKGDSPKLISASGDFSLVGESLLLQTTGKEFGDIWIQPSVNSSTIFPNGNVGIGRFKPEQKLVVVGAEPFSSIVSIFNSTNASNDSPHLLDLKLGVPESSSQGTFVRFYAKSTMEQTGTLAGSIRLNKGGVVFETKGADFAEYFETDRKWPVGTVMSISQRGVSQARSHESIIGVVSEGAGFVGNSQEGKKGIKTLVGMVGQLDVFASTENGELQNGDSLQVGTIPGRGVKDTTNGSRIGFVLSTENVLKFSNNQCPHEFRHLLDPFGKLIRCGMVPIVIQAR